MAWLTNSEAEGSNRFLKIKSPDKKGEAVRTTIRVLDPEPEYVFRHWFNRRPYNCPGRNCPVCAVRKSAMDRDSVAAKKDYQMELAYFFNVLYEGEVKLLVFKNAVAAKLRDFIHEYGDLRNYDVTLVKRRTGPMDFNIEWDLIYKGERVLTDAEKGAAEHLYDLKLETTPASHEDLEQVARGEIPQKNEDEELNQNESSLQGQNQVKTEYSDKMNQFLAIVESMGKTAEDVGVDVENPPSDRILTALIRRLEE